VNRFLFIVRLLPQGRTLNLSGGDLQWQVSSFEAISQPLETSFSKLKPICERSGAELNVLTNDERAHLHSSCISLSKSYADYRPERDKILDAFAQVEEAYATESSKQKKLAEEANELDYQ
jgi:hypothetical protein